MGGGGGHLSEPQNSESGSEWLTAFPVRTGPHHYGAGFRKSCTEIRTDVLGFIDSDVAGHETPALEV